MREDKPLVSPSLLELSACVVAQNESCSLLNKEYFFEDECSEKASSIQLPVNCVESIMKCVCDNLRFILTIFLIIFLSFFINILFFYIVFIIITFNNQFFFKLI